MSALQRALSNALLLSWSLCGCVVQLARSVHAIVTHCCLPTSIRIGFSLILKIELYDTWG